MGEPTAAQMFEWLKSRPLPEPLAVKPSAVSRLEGERRAAEISITKYDALKLFAVVARQENAPTRLSALVGARLNHYAVHVLMKLLQKKAYNEAMRFREEARKQWQKAGSTAGAGFEAIWAGIAGEVASRLAVVSAYGNDEVKVEEPADSHQLNQMLLRDVEQKIDFRAAIKGEPIDFQVKMVSNPNKGGDEWVKIARESSGLVHIHIYYNGADTELLDLATGKPKPAMLRAIALQLPSALRRRPFTREMG